MTATTDRILTVLAAAGDRGLTGPELRSRTGSGVVAGYPHLARLRAAGLVTRHRDTTQPGGARRRCIHRVTDLGRAEARQLHLLPAPRRTPTLWRRAAPAPVASGSGTASSDASGTRWPHPVLVRNHLLGGTLHRPVDRVESARLRARDPAVDTRARAVEADRERVLRALADHGLAEQVLDLSTGVPAARVVRSAHVALARVDPPVPVVYVVTYDRLAEAARAATRCRRHVDVLVADPFDARGVWRAVTGLDPLGPGRRIHPGRPVVLDALTISDLVPRPRRLRSVLRSWRHTVRPGSVLLLARSPDQALPDPLPLARQAGWHPLPAFPPPAPVTGHALDHPAQVTTFTTAPPRWRRRPT
ncbi:SAM-dependent methyltransferase [Actinosynnema sp. NPDC050436]|uniref:SAM-dependent methyltransferase n=1 Tax=Actinosynnema sp. NPDC050436 TaxID=3155659 RepID=UPI0033D8E72A